MQDIREILFKDIADQRFTAKLTTRGDGILSGVAAAESWAQKQGITLTMHVPEGGKLAGSQCFATVQGSALELTRAENELIGLLSKTSGIATAARRAMDLSGGRVRIVSGAMKKMPPDMKNSIRLAIRTGGVADRMVDGEMVYIDKNYIRMLGGITQALKAAKQFPERKRVIQIRGETSPVETECAQALEGGADVLMVDTGREENLRACLTELEKLGQRQRVKVAFAGNVGMSDIRRLSCTGLDILCIGREIVDADLLDMRMDVIM